MDDAVNAIREQIALHIGSKVSYHAANGRRKAAESQGQIVGAYPKLFTLYVESQNSTVSFSYADVLTKEVELRLIDDKTKTDGAEQQS